MDKFTEQFDAMMDERLNRSNNIAANFGIETPLEKSISQDQFDDQFGEGHDVFEKSALSQYITDLAKSVEDSSEEEQNAAFTQAGELIKGLQPVILRTSGDTTKTVFVRPTPESTEETSE